MPVEIKVPRLTQTMTEAEIVRWIKAEGDVVKVGDPLLEIVTDKATVDVESPSAGILGSILVAEGIAPVGQVICLLLAPDEMRVGSAHAESSGPVESRLQLVRNGEEVAGDGSGRPGGASIPGMAGAAGKIRISPLARRLAAENGVDLAVLAPSGPGGLIVERDVKAHLATRVVAGTPLLQAIPPVEDVAFSPPPSDEEVIPLVGVRRVIADRMTLSRHTAADVTTVAEVDMGEVAALREHLPFTYTAFAARAVALALTEFPILNSRLDGNRIVVNKRVHLGVAVAIDQGLKVPVLKDAHTLSLRTMSEVLADRAKRGAEGGLTPEELSGSTFTLTNSGVFGSLFFTPIINPPESAILGMGKIVKTPVVRDDQIVIRPMMYLCLTYDHRVVDGAPAVKFLQRVKGLLEKPALML